jgi:hypothetical protein
MVPRMRVVDVTAFATSFPVPPEASVTLGIGRAAPSSAMRWSCA